MIRDAHLGLTGCWQQFSNNVFSNIHLAKVGVKNFFCFTNLHVGTFAKLPYFLPYLKFRKFFEFFNCFPLYFFGYGRILGAKEEALSFFLLIHSSGISQPRRNGWAKDYMWREQGRSNWLDGPDNYKRYGRASFVLKQCIEGIESQREIIMTGFASR